MKVKSFLKDVGGASRVTKARENAFANASTTPKKSDPINDVARLLHPGELHLVIESIREASPTAKTFRFVAEEGHLPYFQPGQFLTLKTKIRESLVTRPYSISSAPYETRGEHPYVEITVRKSKGDGFFSDYLYDRAKVGDKFISEVGLGQFYHDPIRDSHDVTCIAGGSGITPFVSMAKAVKHSDLDINLTILFGSVTLDDIILKDELEACVCDKVKVVHVLSGVNPGWKGETGFIGHDKMEKYSTKDTTFFVCGPSALYDYAASSLAKINVPKRRIRFEVFGETKHVETLPDFPEGVAEKTFQIKVLRGIHQDVIPAKGNESILVALERAGIDVKVQCRSGVCACCRIRVLEGNFYINKDNDVRRAADKDFGYVHACATYPVSDLTIRIPIK